MIILSASVLIGLARSVVAAEDPNTTAHPSEWRVCSIVAGRMPDTIQLPNSLRAEAAHMLRSSPTFRSQCHRIASAHWVQVRLRLCLYGDHHGYRARSVIHRLGTGELVALVDLPVLGSPIEWIAHEFEHILEQIEGEQLPALAGKAPGVWRSSSGAFETSRAIRAGRAVAAEVRDGGERSHKDVE